MIIELAIAGIFIFIGIAIFPSLTFSAAAHLIIRRFCTPSMLWIIINYIIGIIGTVVYLVWSGIFSESPNEDDMFFLITALSLFYCIGTILYFRVNPPAKQDKYNNHKPADTYVYNNTFSNDISEGSSSVDMEEKAANELCHKLKNKIVINIASQNKTQLTFKPNLVTDYENLQLNFEIKKISNFSFSKIDTIIVKANFYDSKSNLIYIDGLNIYFDEFTHDRYTDYIYFDYDDIHVADRLEIDIYIRTVN